MTNPLFGPAEDWENNACLNFTSDQWGLYASGYERAAEVLTEHVASQRSDQDVLLYPIVFLSRHYLELLLKGTLLTAQDLLGRPRNLPGHHDVEALWQLLRPMVLEIYAGDDPTQLAELETVIRALVELDRTSSAFRYPTNRSGAPALPDQIQHINIRKFSELFHRGARLLEGIQCGIAEYNDARRSSW